MCGRYTIRTSLQKIIEAMSPVLAKLDPILFESRYNVAPSQDVPALRATEAGRELVMLHWGLVPRWADDPAIGNRMINARAETADTKPAFREAFKRRRCLLVADGFYEWKTEPDGKQPYFIHMRDDAPFAIAGLWEKWKHEDQSLESCTLLTTSPNTIVKPIHDRMPVILSKGDYDAWLDPKTDPDAIKKLLKPFAAEAMDARPVDRNVNNPKAKGPFDRPKDVQPEGLWRI